MDVHHAQPQGGVNSTRRGLMSSNALLLWCLEIATVSLEHLIKTPAWEGAAQARAQSSSKQSMSSLFADSDYMYYVLQYISI